MIELAFLLFAYLAGSLSAGMFVARAMGLGDPREAGSGNPGATNLLRLGGRRAAAITLVADAAKGVVPVLVARAFELDSLWLAAIGLAAFLGHLYPLYFGFRGGKGVATGFGVLLAWSWPAGAIALATWLLVAAVLRLSSLAALSSFALAPLYTLLITNDPRLAAAAAAMALLTAWRHRSNIGRIARGEEPRIGKKS